MKQRSITIPSEEIEKGIQEMADLEKRSWSAMAGILLEAGYKEKTRKKKKKENENATLN